MIIDNKHIMYEMLRQGKFGNTLESYSSFEEFGQKSKYRGRVGIRSLEPGGPFKVSKWGCVASCLNTWFKGKPYNISPAIPESDVLMNGMLLNDNLVYSYKQLRMSEAIPYFIDEDSPTLGRLLLKDLMDIESYDNILQLQDTYPEHVIEFTVFNRKLGLLNLNTIIWEVRKY